MTKWLCKSLSPLMNSEGYSNWKCCWWSFAEIFFNLPFAWASLAHTEATKPSSEEKRYSDAQQHHTLNVVVGKCMKGTMAKSQCKSLLCESKVARQPARRWQLSTLFTILGPSRHGKLRYFFQQKKIEKWDHQDFNYAHWRQSVDENSEFRSVI